MSDSKYNSIDELNNVLTPAEPLGPIAHERIRDDHLVYSKIKPFDELDIKPHMLFLGRRGAGKSAILSHVRLKAKINIPEDEPIKGRDYVIEVKTWQYFHYIAQNVRTLLTQEEKKDIDIIPPELFVDLWHQSLWDEIIRYFYNYYPYDEECRKLLEPVNQYVNPKGNYDIHRYRQAENIFLQARKAIIDFLKQRSSKLYFLFDSMEKYPLRDFRFTPIMSGVFQGLTKINDESPQIVVAFCIPEEVEPFIESMSANLMKDFTSIYRIRWRPIDLIRVIAHRLRMSAHIHDKNLYNEIKNLDFSKRDDLHKVFNLILPKKIKNTLGTDEDPLAYIIRHTQLLPRQVLAIFNIALSYQYKENRTFKNITEKHLINGVFDAQKLIAKQILDPYQQIYPKLLARCRDVLPNLDPICDFNSLRKAEKRFNRVVEDDIGSVWQTLFDIGIIGRSTGKSGIDSHTLNPDDRYCYGQFYFNSDRSFVLATDDEFCFHPIFSRAFGMVRRKKEDGRIEKRVVYPANINLDNIYEEE